MKRLNVDVDTLTECADDLSLYQDGKKQKNYLNNIARYMPNLFKKSTVDFVYMAIADVLKCERKMQKCAPSESIRQVVLQNLLHLIKEQDIVSVNIVDGKLYCDGKMVDDKDISYAIYSNDEVSEVMTTLQNPLCLWIQFANYGFCIVREIHESSIILNTGIRKPSELFHSELRFDNEFVDTLINNANNTHKRRCLLMC